MMCIADQYRQIQGGIIKIGVVFYNTRAQKEKEEAI